MGIVAGRGRDLPPRDEFGLSCLHGDDAAGGIPAKQRALRSAQDLDLADIGEVTESRTGTAPIDAVNEHADGLLKPGVLACGADTANGEDRLGRAGAGVDGKGGGHNLQVADIADLGSLELLAGIGGHGHRDVEQALGPFGRLNDDLVQPRGLRAPPLGILRQGSIGHRHGRCERQKRNAESLGGSHNNPPLGCHAVESWSLPSSCLAFTRRT